MNDRAIILEYGTGTAEPSLLRQLMVLSLPVLAENVLHMLVGLTDTWLANHLSAHSADAGSAVGTMAYVIWFMGLLVGAVATGSTALIARAMGARHRSLANKVCGQSITASIIMGAAMGLGIYLGAGQMVRITGLQGEAATFGLSYMKMLCISLPFLTLMLTANACLRGAGDTLTPAIAMIVVDVVNIIFSFGFTYGWVGLPKMGFNGIALGTVIAYIAGGLLQFVVLLAGRGGLRLLWGRLWPHWHTLKRILRIGIPTGLEGTLQWMANFVIVMVLNRVDAENILPAAHNNAIRIESISFMCGFAVATAAATMVGKSLGAKDPRRASRCAYMAYAVGGSIMTLCGIIFILFGGLLARFMSADARVIEQTRNALFVTGFIQAGFAAAIIFGGALRGAGDTLVVMVMNLSSILTIRLAGILIVGWNLRLGLGAIWAVLSGELFLRGVLMYWRFTQGGWKKLKV